MNKEHLKKISTILVHRQAIYKWTNSTFIVLLNPVTSFENLETEQIKNLFSPEMPKLCKIRLLSSYWLGLSTRIIIFHVYRISSSYVMNMNTQVKLLVSRSRFYICPLPVSKK